MISGRDRATLPAGVALRDEGVSDAVRGRVFELNEAGRFVLAHADGRTLDEIAVALAARFRLSPVQARRHVTAFARDLNAKLLLNLTATPGAHVLRWLGCAPRLLPSGLLPAFPLHRRPLDTRRPSAAALAIAWGILPQALLLALAGAALVALPLAGTRAAGLLFALPFGTGAAAGLVVHEAAHAALLRDVPSCVGTAGLRAFVLHRSLPAGRRALVSVAGPAVTLAVGLLLLLAALPLASVPLALGAVPLVAHGLGLTVAAQDGRAACGIS